MKTAQQRPKPFSDVSRCLVLALTLRIAPSRAANDLTPESLGLERRMVLCDKLPTDAVVPSLLVWWPHCWSKLFFRATDQSEIWYLIAFNLRSSYVRRLVLKSTYWKSGIITNISWPRLFCTSCHFYQMNILFRPYYICCLHFFGREHSQPVITVRFKSTGNLLKMSYRSTTLYCNLVNPRYRYGS